MRYFLRIYRTRTEPKMAREKIIIWRTNNRDTFINYWYFLKRYQNKRV